MMDKARVVLVLHSNNSNSRWLGIRASSSSSSIRVNLNTGTKVVLHKQMHPCLSYRSQSMDTHRPTLLLVIVIMHTHTHTPMHTPMRQREVPQCTPRPSPLRPHSGRAAVALKVKGSIFMVQDLLPTHSRRKCKAISSNRTPRPRTQQGHTKPTLPLDPLAVVLDQSHDLPLPWRLRTSNPMRIRCWLRGRFLRRQGPGA
jgi:hypothetical protein